MNDPAIIYGTIDALAFAAGAALCAMLAVLQWRSPQVVGGQRDLIILWLAGLLWTGGCFVSTLMLLGGAAESSPAVRGVMTAAWSSTCVGPLMAMRAANASLDGRLPARRFLYALGALAGLGVFAMLVAASLDPTDDFSLMGAALRSFFVSLAFLTAFFVMHFTLGGGRRRKPRRAVAPMGRVIMAFWLAWIALTLFNILTPSAAGGVNLILGQINQHWAIPASILAAVSLAKTHYADVVLKRSLALLLAIFGAAAVAWQIPGLPRGVPLVAASLLAAASMLAAPGLFRLLGRLLDRYLLQRPDYRALAASYGEAAGRAGDEPELAATTERAISQALGLDARLDPGSGAEADAETIPFARDRTISLAPAIKARALMQAEHSFLEAVGAEYARRREALAFEAERREREQREARLKHAVTEARLEALRAQVDPHFLFNTLNAITDLIATDPDKAETMTERLAAFFRYTLDRQEQTVATLDEELDFVRQYLDIESVRFGDRLKVEIKKDKSLGEEAVPSLILQPLVENALRHGLSSRREGGRISVTAERDGSAIRLEVADNGVGFTAKSQDRVGLTNVRERLRALHGEAASVTIGKGLGGKGASIVLCLPA